MAQLNFDGIKPVGFGGRECMPSTDAELKLRIQSLKFGTGADEAHADEILAKAFPKDEEYVREFLSTQMSTFEKQQLQAYLISGASGIRLIDQIINAQFDKVAGGNNG